MTKTCRPPGGVVALAVGFFALLLATSFHPEYGHYADEFNYIGCAKRPALGYVDHPPLAPLILAVNRLVLGDSLPALRILPALCGAFTILLAAWMASKLGGGVFAQMLAALCVVTAPLYLGVLAGEGFGCNRTELS
jgi:predicted membrane-bound dolichyl-phosphate-mannose-protein mannosyltransferase